MCQLDWGRADAAKIKTAKGILKCTIAVMADADTPMEPTICSLEPTQSPTDAQSSEGKGATTPTSTELPELFPEGDEMNPIYSVKVPELEPGFSWFRIVPCRARTI